MIVYITLKIIIKIIMIVYITLKTIINIIIVIKVIIEAQIIIIKRIIIRILNAYIFKDFIIIICFYRFVYLINPRINNIKVIYYFYHYFYLYFFILEKLLISTILYYSNLDYNFWLGSLFVIVHIMI